MRHLIVPVLLPAVLLQGCTSATTVHPSTASAQRSGAPARVDFQAIDDELGSDPATVELASGEVVKARSVVLGPETTSWRDAAGRERTVPTAEVRRVLQEQRHMAGKGFGYGAAATVVPAYLVAQHNQQTSGAYAFVVAALVA